MPLGLNQEMSCVTSSMTGFVTVQMIEYALPAIAVPLFEVDTATLETGTVRIDYY